MSQITTVETQTSQLAERKSNTAGKTQANVFAWKLFIRGGGGWVEKFSVKYSIISLKWS